MENRISSSEPSRLKVMLAFAAVYLIWGSTYLAIRIAIETIPPFLMAGIRFLCAGALLYVFARAAGASKPEPRHWKSAFVIGGFLLLGGNGGVVWAEQFVPSGITALIIATVPLWTILLQWLWQREGRPRPAVALGVVTGLAGLYFLLGPSASATRGVDPVGGLILVTAALSWAIGSLYSRRAPLPESSFLATAMEMLGGGSLLLAAGLLTGEAAAIHPQNFSVRSVLALAYLIFFGALVGFTCYIWILKVTAPAKSSTYAYVNPLVAVFLGWAFAGEALTPKILTGAAVILGAVALITLSGTAKAADKLRGRTLS